RKTAPLVRVEHLQAHLTLLHVFHSLKSTVSATGAPDLTPEERWVTFVHRAVARFFTWGERVVSWRGPEVQPLKALEIPPIDVLMVWHAYLLNPRCYYEDCIR
ncbi:hypothetical protein DACRYDRAFT_40927, partial [Dacryopinax primogenitus]